MITLVAGLVLGSLVTIALIIGLLIVLGRALLEAWFGD